MSRMPRERPSNRVSKDMLASLADSALAHTGRDAALLTDEDRTAAAVAIITQELTDSGLVAVPEQILAALAAATMAAAERKE